MIKLLWYGYFVIYLLFTLRWRVKYNYLKRKSPEEAALYAHQKVIQMSEHILKVSRTQVEVIGKENLPDETCVFISNHQAIFDAFLLFAHVGRPIGFIAKKEIDKLPIVRSWLKYSNTIFMDRSDPRDSVRAINAGAENLKRGCSMAIFPEGTRSLKSEMADFKKGSLKLAIKAKVPVVPVTIDGTYRVLEVGNKVRGHKISLVIHKPIYPNTLPKEEQNELTDKLHDIIEEELIKIRNQNY